MKLGLLVSSVFAGVVSASVYADGNSHSHKNEGGETKMKANVAAMSSGEIRRVSKGSKKLTVRHGPIANLDMPPMTMAFTVSDDKMLDTVKKGDKVKFRAESIDGKMVITEIVAQ
ncbi:MAG: copper-binding protein [Burkholderiaceae bacterium]